MQRSLLQELSTTPLPTINLVDYIGNNHAPRASPKDYLLREEYMKANKEYVDIVLKTKANKEYLDEIFRKTSHARLTELENIRVTSAYDLTNIKPSENINSFHDGEFLIATNLRVCTQQQIDFITASLPHHNISSFLMKSITSKNIASISCLLETMKYSKIGSNELEHYLLHRWLHLLIF